MYVMEPLHSCTIYKYPEKAPGYNTHVQLDLVPNDLLVSWQPYYQIPHSGKILPGINFSHQSGVVNTELTIDLPQYYSSWYCVDAIVVHVHIFVCDWGHSISRSIFAIALSLANCANGKHPLILFLQLQVHNNYTCEIKYTQILLNYGI